MKAAAAAGVAALLLLPVLLLLAVGSALTGSGSGLPAGTITCLTTGGPTSTPEGFAPDQIANAATIVAVGNQLNVPAQGQVIAIAAALQESGLRNLTYGDRDSLGLFQQRPSQGWGTPAQVTDPAYAAAAFYRALLAVPGWQQLSLTAAAQAVQRSAFPDAYAQHQPAALTLTAAVGGATCTVTAPIPSVARAIAFAQAQIGQPYVWGGDGGAEGGFDCSGLTAAAYGAAGIALPRTADTQYRAGPAVPDGQPLLPGDLIFYGTTARVTHVALYLGNGNVINAPTFGQSVRVQAARYPGDRYVGATRPAAARA